MKRKAIALFGAAAVLSALAAPVAYASPPPPGGVTIEIANVSGPNSCKGDGLAISEDHTAFTITYGDFQARAGGDSAPADRRKKCTIMLRIHVPREYTFGIDRAEYRGFAELAAGAGGTLKARTFFQGMVDPPVRETLGLKGSYSKNWWVVDEVPPEQVIYKPCGETRNLYLESELAVDPGTSDNSKTSVMGMDSVDGSIKSAYRIAWKTCPK